MRSFLRISLVGLMVLGAAAALDLAHAQQKPAPAKGPKVALTGLDPIEFVAGKAVKGKKSIALDHNGFRYNFASQKNRDLFTKDPDRYGIQGDGTCPVVPKAKVDPGIVTLYKGKIYAFATLPCVGRFGKDPEKYLAAWPGNPDHKKNHG
jgi:YHS domain-containing protein